MVGPIADPQQGAETDGRLLPLRFPLRLEIEAPDGLYGGAKIPITLHPGITTFVGPNASGKTRVLRALCKCLRAEIKTDKRIRYLASGRSASLQQYRAAVLYPSPDNSPAAVGNIHHAQQRWDIEGKAYAVASGLISML